MITIQISQFLTITSIAFFLGFLGLILNRKNILITIMSLEIMLLAGNLNFIIFSIYLDNIVGQIFVIFVLTVAATESALGLAILMAHYRLKNNIKLNSIKNISKNI
jgi:NADH-quinone oxidoreductase subunit K